MSLTIEFLGEKIEWSDSHKHLGVIMQSKLNYLGHIKSKISKAKSLLIRLRNCMGKVHGLKPRAALTMYKWSRAVITHGCLVWHQECEKKSVIKRLRDFQSYGLRSCGCLRRSTPTAALEILTDTTPLHLHVRELSAKEAQTPEKNKESTEESGHNEDSNDYLNKQFEEDLKEAWNDFWSQKLRKMKKARPPTNGEKDEFLSDYLKNNAEYIKDKYGIEIPAGGFNCYNKRQERRRKKRK